MNQLILGDNSAFKPILPTDKKNNEGLEAVEVVKVKINGVLEIE